MNSYEIANHDAARLAFAIGPERAMAFRARLRRLSRTLHGRRLVNITGDDRRKGGVYELMRSGLPYLRGAGVDVCWVDLTTRPEARPALEYFHVLAHGRRPSPDWRSDLSLRSAEFARFGRDAAAELTQVLRPSDLLVLHDTQTAPVVGELGAWAPYLVWLAQIGTADRNERVDRYWDVVAPSVSRAGVTVFYTPDYAPTNLLAQSIFATPSIDPSTPKSALLGRDRARALLTSPPAGWPLRWVAGAPRQRRDVNVLAVQLSRWDPLKDMTGAYRIMRAAAAEDPTFYGMVVGPSVQSESERRELQACLDEAERTPAGLRDRIGVGVVDDCGSDDHDMVVRVLQSAADIVLQKSVQEGFGLTVTEGMLRGKAVIASAVGGIQLQLTNDRNGVLVDPASEDQVWVARLQALISDEPARSQLGRQGRSDVLERHTVDRQMTALMDGVESKLLHSQP